MDVPIPGTRKLERLEENIAAADMQLTHDDLREIESGPSKITVPGSHNPEEVKQWTNQSPEF